MQLGADRLIEQQAVAHVVRDRLRQQHEHGAQPGVAGADRRRQAVMRADAAEGDHAAPSALPGRAEQELELARLVAAVQRAAAVVALDPQRAEVAARWRAAPAAAPASAGP